ncbi:MAG: glycosyltransferase 87 family protein [Gaiellaceae bacterium]
MQRVSAAGVRSRLLSPAATDLLIVVGSAWVVRAVAIAIWPATAHSVDLNSWEQVAFQLRHGTNPYATTDILKWPPFALVLVWSMDHAAVWLRVSFFTVMRATLVAAEGAVAIVLYFLMTRFAPAREVRRILLVGICFNPIAILFSVQHENIDVFVGLCVALALWALVSADRARDAAGWLASSLALGLGVFVKTVPLALIPLLAPEARRASKLGRTLALALFLGPALLSLAVVVVFGPHAVLDNVLGYRSLSGYFGITGLLDLAHLNGVTRLYVHVFTVVLVVGAAVLFRVLWNRGLDARRAILLAGLILAAIPAIGPGYAPQYAYWFMPALIASYPLFDDGWRRILLVCYAVAAVTFVIEYGLIAPYGHFLNGFFGDTALLHRLGNRISTPGAETVFRLPLFAAILVVLAGGCRRVWPKAGVEDRSVG